MKKGKKKWLLGAGCAFAAFALWTAAVCLVDVRPIGPQGTAVGFAAVNGWFHRLTGVHMWLYTITDWLSLIPLGVVMGFGLLGLWQWIKRKSLFRVDRDLLILGGFYLAVIAGYLLFEVLVVNYRPVLIQGQLEVSYPSSTTMLVLCVMPTAAMQLSSRVKCAVCRRCVVAVKAVFVVLMVAGRLISGVHWVTDIIGGMLLSAGLVGVYAFLIT